MFRRKCLNCGKKEVNRKTDICDACKTQHARRAGFEWAYSFYVAIIIPIWLFTFVYGWTVFIVSFFVMFAIYWLIDFAWPLKIKQDT
jgi:hypothetical protein